MTRKEALVLAHQITKTLVALNDKPEAQGGVKLAAIMISEIVAADGRINADVFLRNCHFGDHLRALIDIELREEDEE